LVFSSLGCNEYAQEEWEVDDGGKEKIARRIAASQSDKTQSERGESEPERQGTEKVARRIKAKHRGH
jgi:hypothetical protein